MLVLLLFVVLPPIAYFACEGRWEEALTAFAALATIVGFVYQTREQRRFEAYWHLYDEWGSADMRSKRRRAAALLLSGEYRKADVLTVDISDVIDFFETLAMLVQRGTVDDYIAWHGFYWWAWNYWGATEDYAQWVRDQEGEQTWEDFQQVIGRWMRREAQRHRPSPQAKNDFLLEESKLPG